ncbi:MAG: hypothetical protein H5T44_06405, partial [Thermoplasmatales archaeon]|nr:hypothetical protein [Thermoplasmatales archaeon]
MKKIFGVSALILFLIAISINSFNSAKKENNEEWNKEFGAEGTISFFVDGIVTDDGIVLLGRIYEKVWVVKIDKEGNEIWNRTFRRNLRVEEYG